MTLVKPEVSLSPVRTTKAQSVIGKRAPFGDITSKLNKRTKKLKIDEDSVKEERFTQPVSKSCSPINPMKSNVSQETQTIRAGRNRPDLDPHLKNLQRYLTKAKKECDKVIKGLLRQRDGDVHKFVLEKNKLRAFCAR